MRLCLIISERYSNRHSNSVSLLSWSHHHMAYGRWGKSFWL